MYRKTLSPTSLCLIVLLLLTSVSFLSAVKATWQAIPNINKMTVAWISFPETVDPHWAYDEESLGLIMQVYDTLIGFDYENPASFVPRLAVNRYVADPPEPGYAMTIVFEMRSNVQWQNGEVSTASDLARHVEYGFERWLFMDRSGGSTWMMFEALFGPGIYSVWDLEDPVNQVDNAVESDWEAGGNSVWFNFETLYPGTRFYQIVSSPWASIINMEWAIDHGCWDGVYANWPIYNNPPISPLDAPQPTMMGTGPYKGPNPGAPGVWGYVDYLAGTWTIRRFADYWEGWPAPGCSDYVDEVTMITEYSWAQRKMLFLSDGAAGQADIVYVPSTAYNDPDLVAACMAGKVAYIEYPLLTLSADFFNFDIPPNSPYAGSFTWTTGIPNNFFDDYDTRYGFAYSFDWDLYINMVYSGAATQPATPLIIGVGFDDLYNELNDALCYYPDGVEARYHLKLAHGGVDGNNDGDMEDPGDTPGELWQNGFTFIITYPSGNIPRQVAARIFEENIEAFNIERPGLPPFNIYVLPVTWSTYLSDLINYPYFQANMPLFVMSHSPEYPDPHPLFFNLFHSQGGYPPFQSYANPTVDALIEQAATEPDPVVRRARYSGLMVLFHDELPSLPLVQPSGRHYERTWVQGWYYNPAYPVPMGGGYFRHLWKGLDGDINADGLVSVADGGVLSCHWHQDIGGGNFFDGPLGYDRKCDINPISAVPCTSGYHIRAYDGLVDMNDVAWFSTCMTPGPP